MQFTGLRVPALARYSNGRSAMESVVAGDRRGLGKMLAVAVATLALMAGCSSAPPRAAEPPPVAVEPRAALPADGALASSQIVSEARSLLGAPYRLGGADPSGLDCSGLVSHVFARAGVATPRTALAQQEAAIRIEWDELIPGDLVFFRLPDPHVGIYLGGGQFIHAPGSGRTVTIANLEEPYFLLSFAGGGRFLQPSSTAR